MIVGNGLLARGFSESFSQNDGVIIFASGVSNSQEISADEYLREEILLRENLKKDKKIIYFSTCSIEDVTARKSPYVKHKIKMESLIKNNSKNFMIFRLPQLIGKTNNKNTLINFLYLKILNNEEFTVQEFAKRNIIDVEHVVEIVKYILDKGYSNKNINIANADSINVSSIVDIFENFLSKKAKYQLISEGSSYLIESKLSSEIAKTLGIIFDDNYLNTAIKKYY
jgi:nucleoside-diphosphate-sugar epimerase